MDKKKYVIFIILGIVFAIYIGLPYLKDFLKESDPSNTSNAEQITLTEGNYTVGKEIEPGTYDINIISDETEVFGKKLNKGDKLLGIRIYDEEKLSIEGKGSLTFSPASFNKLDKNETGYKISHSGNYIVGKQIPEGKYIASYKDPKSIVDRKPFIQVSKSIGKDIVSSIQLKNQNKNQFIELEKDNILHVAKSLDNEYNLVEIILIPTK